MSLSPIEFKTKRLSSLGEGTHLAIIYDMKYLRNGAKELIKSGEFPIMVVVFKNDKSLIHEQHYIIDNSFRQEQFEKMLVAANVKASEGNTPTKKDAIGKRLWISIKKVININDGIPILNGPSVDYFIFQVNPYIDGGKKPNIKGDPERNEGISSGEFIEYNNIALKETKTEIDKVKLFIEKSKTKKGIVDKPKEQVIVKEDIDLNEEPQF